MTLYQGPLRCRPPGFPSGHLSRQWGTEVGQALRQQEHLPPPSVQSWAESSPGCQACFFSRKGQLPGPEQQPPGSRPAFSRLSHCPASALSIFPKRVQLSGSAAWVWGVCRKQLGVEDCL